MIQLRLVVPSHLTPRLVEGLARTPGVAHLARMDGASALPPGDVVICDVAREAADAVVEWLQREGVHRTGAITVEALEAVISDAAAAAEEAAPGHSGDALIWEELEGTARREGQLTTSFLVFICVASVIAGVGILLDSPILIVGAMVVGPEYGPLAAVSVWLARRRHAAAGRAALTLGVGLLGAVAASLVATAAFRATGLAPDAFELSERELTAFISRPDGMAAVVAVLAGIVGMLSLTESRSGALVGVLVSVTTIPAAANAGAAMAYGEWGEVSGAAAQLAVNVAGLVAAGLATLLVQARTVRSRRELFPAP